MTQSRNTVTVVEATSVLNSTGGSPLVFRFSDRPFTDRDAGWVAEAALLAVPSVRLSRTQGSALRGSTAPTGTEVRIAPSVATRQALSGRNFEKQSLRWWRVDRSVETLTGVDPAFTGLSSESDWSDSDLVISTFSLEKIFEPPIQPLKWAGRGLAVRFADTATTSAPGYIETLEPSANFWDVASAITVEAGFYTTELPGDVPQAQHAAIVDRGDEWLLGMDINNDEVTFFFGATSGAVKISSGLEPSLNVRYHVAGQWDGADLRAGYDGAWTGGPLAESNPPTNASEDLWVGGSKAAAFVGNPLRGAVDFVRVWIDYVPTWAELQRYANCAVPARLQRFVALELLLNEGLGAVVYDDERLIRGDFSRQRTTWEPTNTGDASLAGKRQPWMIGFVPNAPAQLVHKAFQRYAISGSEVESVIPRNGARRLQKALSWSSLTLTFDNADKTIKDHRSGNVEWAELLAGAVLRITGTVSNNTDHRLARDAFRVGDFYFVELATPPVTEASVVSTLAETVSTFITEASAVGTVDFDKSEGSIIAKSGQVFALFGLHREVTVGGSVSNDGTFTITAAPFLNASFEWVLFISPPPTDGVADAGVTVTQPIDIGEYDDSAPDDVLGQFQLTFEPEKEVTSEAFGNVTAGVTPRTAADQLKWVLDNGPPLVQAVPYSTGRLATMARKFPALSGVAQGLGEVLTVAQVRDILAASMGAHAWISPRTGGFEVLDWPFVVRNPILIDQAFLAWSGATPADAGDLGDDPDSGVATAAGVVLTNPASVSNFLAAVDQVERPYVETFLVRIAAVGSKSTVTMKVDAWENLAFKAGLGFFEVDTTEAVFEATLNTDDLTNDEGEDLEIRIENFETDGSSLTVGAVELVPTWKVIEIGPEDVFNLDPQPSVPGAAAAQVLYSVNKVRLSAGDVALPVLSDRSAAGREALERATNDFLVASFPAVVDDDADLLTLETALVEGEDAEELAEAVFAGSGTNTFLRLRLTSALLEQTDPFFQLLRFSSGWLGVLSGVTDDVDVVEMDEGDVETALQVVLVGRAL